MTAFTKTWLAMGLLFASALGACSTLVSPDRSKIEDEQFEPPPPDAGSDEDAG